MGLAGLLMDAKTSTGDGSLTHLIENGFARKEKKPPLQATGGRYLRASGLPKLCPREEVICSIEHITRPDDVDAGLNLTFLHGTALHWAVQNQLLGPLGCLYGTWKCNDCGRMYGQPMGQTRYEDWAIPMPTTPCTTPCRTDGCCDSTSYTYVEASFKDDDLRLTGHADGFLVLPGLPGMGVLEIKSIGARYAREIKVAPQYDHIIQAHAYMLFTGFKWGKILYWQKAESGLSCLVEHHVERDEETIRRIQDAIRSTWAGVVLKSPPERICASQDCAKAKSCPVASLCFRP